MVDYQLRAAGANYRVANLFLSPRSTLEEFAQIISFLPKDTRILWISEATYRFQCVLTLTSQKFREFTDEGAEIAEIKVISEYVEDRAEGIMKRKITDVEWPVDIDFPALKRKE